MITTLGQGGRRLAVVVLLVGLGGELLSSCSSAPALTPSASIAPAIQVSGRSIPYDGLQRWSVASVLSRDSTQLTIFATGSEEGGGACGPPIVRLRAEESATSVRVFVADYQQPASAGTACPAIGYLPSAQRIRLREPIRGRTVIDASNGKKHVLLVGSEYPRLNEVPSSFVATPLGRNGGTGAVEQAWADRGESVLSLETSEPAASRKVGPYGRIVRQLDIGGTSATVYRSGTGRYGQMSVQWTPNPTQTITVRFSNTAHTRWTLDRAITIARAVSGYRTRPTGRLPQPSTPGTAAASYNSADGPVDHAANMLKSSGVYIGVNCQGIGRVTVSLPGSDYRFTCGEKTSHHLAQSTGKPDETFYLDVTATAGVRWALTLARASLDGS